MLECSGKNGTPMQTSGSLSNSLKHQVVNFCSPDEQGLSKELNVGSISMPPMHINDQFTDMKPKSEVPSSEKKSRDLNCITYNGNIVSVKEVELHQQQQKDRHEIHFSILRESLENLLDRSIMALDKKPAVVGASAGKTKRTKKAGIVGKYGTRYGLVYGSRLRRWKLVNTAIFSVNFVESMP